MLAAWQQEKIHKSQASSFHYCLKIDGGSLRLRLRKKNTKTRLPHDDDHLTSWCAFEKVLIKYLFA